MDAAPETLPPLSRRPNLGLGPDINAKKMQFATEHI